MGSMTDSDSDSSSMASKTMEPEPSKPRHHHASLTVKLTPSQRTKSNSPQEMQQTQDIAESLGLPCQGGEGGGERQAVSQSVSQAVSQSVHVTSLSLSAPSSPEPEPINIHHIYNSEQWYQTNAKHTTCPHTNPTRSAPADRYTFNTSKPSPGQLTLNELHVREVSVEIRAMPLRLLRAED